MFAKGYQLFLAWACGVLLGSWLHDQLWPPLPQLRTHVDCAPALEKI